MTDDESRNAFEEWAIRTQAETEIRSWDWHPWQAAVEWATKRAMERCAALCRKARDEQQLLLEVPIDVSERWEVAEECALLIEQEPTS